jgi:dTMP kinase
MKCLYIVFEGVVGTGKSTQSKKLYEFLKKQFPEKETTLTREPGGDEIAEAIRKLVQATDFKQEMMPECEAYLYAASRAQSLRTVVKPALERGAIVISDRSFLTSAAYQGHARGLGIEKILEINKAAAEIIPDIIFYIDMEPAEGLRRSFDKSGDKFEKEDVEFFRKVEAGYKELSKRYKQWVNIDGNGSIEKVHRRIAEKLRLTLPFP